jgi:D-alanyl-D-alanine carboxypeptidase
MSVTFSEEERKNLVDAICNSTESRSYSANKKDLKKFLMVHFKKIKIVDKKVEDQNKKEDDKNEKKLSDMKNNGTKDGFKIVEVSNKYDFPVSIYKKDSPILAAESASKAIIKKNKLGIDASFIFSIKKENRCFKYTFENENLKAHHGR